MAATGSDPVARALSGNGASSSSSAPAQIPEGTSELSAVRPKSSPQGPSTLEREAHEVTHSPYRSWCRACVAGYGRSDAHSSVYHRDEELPTIALDYCYLNDPESDERASPVLVVKDTHDKWPDSEVVPCKGVQHPYSVAVLVDILVNHGHSKYILKSDGEPAILEMKRAAAAECRANHGHTIIFEESPVGEHQSNGFIEECVRSVKAKCRTLKFACEELHGTKISSEHPVLPWLVRHASACLAYGQRGPDGRTPYERKRAKSFRISLPCFGEKVLYLRIPKRSGLDDRWNEGIFVGLVRRTQELLVATPEGVYKCRSVKRMTSEERIDRNAFDSIRGAPWQPIPGQALMDVPVSMRVEIPAVIPHSELPPPVEVAPPNRRRTYTYPTRHRTPEARVLTILPRVCG